MGGYGSGRGKISGSLMTAAEASDPRTPDDPIIIFWHRVFNVAIKDARGDSQENREYQQEAREFLTSEYIQMVLRWIYGDKHAMLVRRWVEAGCPDTDHADPKELFR